jgi:hypothetical protein
MGHCTDCYGTSVIAPCATVGCLSTNYGKCITYSGLDLYCATGAIGTVSITGTAVVPGTITTYSNVSGTNLSGSGVSATFDIVRTPGTNTYTVTVANRGSGYAPGNQITILGTSVGGTSPANDITITIQTLNAVIPSGADLDSIIVKFHNALCSASSGGEGGGGLDYSILNYSCLRQNGVVTGIGSPITTETQFVQSISSAVCTVNTNLINYDTAIILDPVEGGIPNLPSTYNLNQYLTTLVAYTNTLGSYIETGTITGNPCLAYAFTTKPTSNLLSDYFNWITTNMCGIYNNLNGTIGATTTTTNSLKTYIAGAGTVPSAVNTSTLPGGSSVSNASTAINLLVSQVTSINSTLTTVPTANYALTWASCFPGTYPSNSVFKSQSWNFTNASASLQTQLDRIVTVLSMLNVKFDATQFNITTGSCGPTVALNSSIVFSPASLNAAILDNLGDVSISTPTNGDILSFDTNWKNKALTVRINGSTASVTKTISTSEVVFDLAIVNSAPAIFPLTPTPTPEYTIITATRFPMAGQPLPYGVVSNGLVSLHGVFQLNISSISWAQLATKTIATLPVQLRPTVSDVYFNVELYVKTGGVYSNTYTRATAQITTTGNLVLHLMNPSGTLTLTTGDSIEVVIGGNTYAI